MSREVPQLPGGSPLIGHILTFARDPLGFLDRVGERYSEIVSFRFGLEKGYLFIHPDAVERVLQSNHTNYDKQTFDYKLLADRLFGTGLLTNEGRDWLKQRRLIQPAFHRKRLELYGHWMHRCTAELVADWKQRDGETVDLAEETAHLALRIAGLALFSRDLTKESAALGDALDRANKLLTKRVFTGVPNFVRFLPLDFRLRRAVKELRRIVDDIIRERRDGVSEYDDLLSMMMDARDDDGRAMDANQLRDEVLTLLLAGHETSATALTWTLYLLAKHPDKRDLLENEVGRGDVPAYADVPKLPYTRGVVQEGMRLFPPVWTVARRAIGADVVMGYDIPAGAQLFVAQWLTQRHGQFWDEPLSFSPERFVPAGGVAKRDGDFGYAYFPFGGGPRLCIGAEFALAELVIALGGIAANVRLELVRDDVGMEPLITLRPKGGMLVRIGVR